MPSGVRILPPAQLFLKRKVDKRNSKEIQKKFKRNFFVEQKFHKAIRHCEATLHNIAYAKTGKIDKIGEKMKPTGPTKESTRNLVLILEKHGKKSKQDVWIDIAKRISRPRRSRVKVNLWKLGKLTKKCKGKIMVVPGKVLSNGEIEAKTEVAALEFSEGAIKKLEERECKHLGLDELVRSKVKSSSVCIVE